MKMVTPRITTLSAFIALSALLVLVRAYAAENSQISQNLKQAKLATHAEEAQAAPQVTLWWKAPEGDVFYNEVTVLESVPSSYFAAAGWDRGYFGIQEHASKDKVIFSVWDPARGDNPESVTREQRTEVLYADPEAAIKRFSGEGTGAQCKYDYKWRAGETYRFLVKAKVDGTKTAYTAWFYLNETKKWKKLAVFRALTGGSRLKDYYSFVEDFRRDGQSAHESRRGLFGSGWVRSAAGKWEPLAKAGFSADPPLGNMEATTKGTAFELTTGGDVKNSTKPNSILTIPKSEKDLPKDLPNEAVDFGLDNPKR